MGLVARSCRMSWLWPWVPLALAAACNGQPEGQRPADAGREDVSADVQPEVDEEVWSVRCPGVDVSHHMACRRDADGARCPGVARCACGEWRTPCTCEASGPGFMYLCEQTCDVLCPDAGQDGSADAGLDGSADAEG